ncbi:MAG: DMT family transporter [Sedimentisphaerales bacterium]|nr:DMT family transporter [Sedimentisphaerales bacterium]
MKNHNKAYIYAAFVVLFWATIPSAFKISLDRLKVDVLPLLFYASFVSLVTFFFCLVFSQKLHLLKNLTKENYLHSAMLGFLNPFLYYCVIFESYTLLPAQQAQPLNFVWPITLVLLSIPLLRQKIRAKDILAILISFFGVFIISTRGDILGFGIDSPAGVSLALGSTIIWSLFWIYNVRDKRDEIVGLFLNFAFGFIFISIALLLRGRIQMPSVKGLLGAAYIGLFEMGITFLLWLKALKLAKTTAHITNLIYLTPFLSLIVVRIVLKEEIFAATIIGVIFIVGGIILQKL